MDGQTRAGGLPGIIDFNTGTLNNVVLDPVYGVTPVAGSIKSGVTGSLSHSYISSDGYYYTGGTHFKTGTDLESYSITAVTIHSTANVTSLSADYVTAYLWDYATGEILYSYDVPKNKLNSSMNLETPWVLEPDKEYVIGSTGTSNEVSYSGSSTFSYDAKFGTKLRNLYSYSTEPGNTSMPTEETATTYYALVSFRYADTDFYLSPSEWVSPEYDVSGVDTVYISWDKVDDYTVGVFNYYKVQYAKGTSTSYTLASVNNGPIDVTGVDKLKVRLHALINTSVRTDMIPPLSVSMLSISDTDVMVYKVNSQATAKYNIKRTVSLNANVNYVIAQTEEVSIESSVKYNIFNVVGLNANTKYNVKQLIPLNVDAKYNVKQPVELNIDANYDIKQPITLSIDTKYNVKQLTSVKTSIEYGIFSTIGLNAIINYNLKAKDISYRDEFDVETNTEERLTFVKHSTDEISLNPSEEIRLTVNKHLRDSINGVTEVNDGYGLSQTFRDSVSVSTATKERKTKVINRYHFTYQTARVTLTERTSPYRTNASKYLETYTTISNFSVEKVGSGTSLEYRLRKSSATTSMDASNYELMKKTVKNVQPEYSAQYMEIKTSKAISMFGFNFRSSSLSAITRKMDFLDENLNSLIGGQIDVKGDGSIHSTTMITLEANKTYYVYTEVLPHEGNDYVPTYDLLDYAIYDGFQVTNVYTKASETDPLVPTDKWYQFGIGYRSPVGYNGYNIIEFDRHAIVSNVPGFYNDKQFYIYHGASLPTGATLDVQYQKPGDRTWLRLSTISWKKTSEVEKIRFVITNTDINAATTPTVRAPYIVTQTGETPYQDLVRGYTADIRPNISTSEKAFKIRTDVITAETSVDTTYGIEKIRNDSVSISVECNDDSSVSRTFREDSTATTEVVNVTVKEKYARYVAEAKTTSNLRSGEIIYRDGLNVTTSTNVICIRHIGFSEQCSVSLDTSTYYNKQSNFESINNVSASTQMRHTCEKHYHDNIEAKTEVVEDWKGTVRIRANANYDVKRTVSLEAKAQYTIVPKLPVTINANVEYTVLGSVKIESKVDYHVRNKLAIEPKIIYKVKDTTTVGISAQISYSAKGKVETEAKAKYSVKRGHSLGILEVVVGVLETENVLSGIIKVEETMSGMIETVDTIIGIVPDEDVMIGIIKTEVD